MVHKCCLDRQAAHGRDIEFVNRCSIGMGFNPGGPNALAAPLVRAFIDGTLQFAQSLSQTGGGARREHEVGLGWKLVSHCAATDPRLGCHSRDGCGAVAGPVQTGDCSFDQFHTHANLDQYRRKAKAEVTKDRRNQRIGQVGIGSIRLACNHEDRRIKIVSCGKRNRLITAPDRAGQTITVGVPTTVNGAILFQSGANVALSLSWDVVAHDRPAIELHGTHGVAAFA